MLEKLEDFRTTLSNFVDGMESGLWGELAEYLRGPWLRGVGASGADARAAELCWESLCDDRMDECIHSYYAPGHEGAGGDEMSRRLAHNARGLFATALAAAAARDAWAEAYHPQLDRWCERALDALGAAPPAEGAPRAADGAVAAEEGGAQALLDRALAGRGTPSAAEATARLWAQWWLLGRLDLGGRAARSTWLTWISQGRPRVGALEVAEVAPGLPALIEHPDVSLLPAEPDWLAAVTRAWELSRCAELGQTVLWRVVMPNAAG